MIIVRLVAFSITPKIGLDLCSHRFTDLKKIGYPLLNMISPNGDIL